MKVRVEKVGLEPTTFCLQSRCSSLMNYNPIIATFSSCIKFKYSFILIPDGMSARFTIRVPFNSFRWSSLAFLPFIIFHFIAEAGVIETHPLMRTFGLANQDLTSRLLTSKCSILGLLRNPLVHLQVIY